MIRNFLSHQRFFWSRFMLVLGAISVFLSILGATPLLQQSQARHDPAYYALILLITFVVAGFQLHRAISGVQFRVREADLDLAIMFGDVLDRPGSVLVPVSTRFRHTLSDNGGKVSKSSVHGQLISRCGGEVAFAKAVSQALDGTAPAGDGTLKDETLDFPVGTVAVLPRATFQPGASGSYFLFAVTEERGDTSGVSSDLPTLVVAMSAALEQIKDHKDATQLALPFVGTGYGRIKLEPDNLLDVQVATVTEFFRRARGHHNVSFVLHPRQRGTLRLYNIEREWSAGL
ncbi:macro domain-containing protein [Poseidonocella sedimentorum]|uniref:Thoeris protein ThsA Macro domain-containing protein n=1 Tax=Poseidonocella sedimentorum TaxID=871652 RepID=A0A1I6CVD8_9RHOB|nr:macro domain-containing protein [Poseidonocella sedimentorum]SFQ97138.1 hypothetical protein SAMN04515673_101436 [Poseidonocella sedimentorum]